MRATFRDTETPVATVALTLVTLAVGLGFGRLFGEGSYVVPIVATVLLSHGVAWWCRRNEIPTPLAAVTTLGATALAITWTALGHTTAYGVPIPHTLRVAADELRLARELFEIVKAPTPVTPGFLVALCFALGIAAFMSDWAAFRLHTAVEALVPGFTLFVFTAALGSGRFRVIGVIAFVVTALGFLLVAGIATRSRLAWFGGRAAGGPAALARAALVVGGVAIVAGVVLGPALPGYASDPLVKYKNRGSGGPSSRSTISPLVDIRGRLVERADIEVFTVASTQRSYWRLTSLDTFDGTIWSSRTDYQSTGGGLGTSERLNLGLDSTAVEQSFTVSGLDSIWLPAAYRPLAITGVDGVSYDRETASLITDQETTDGSRYLVRSAVPAYSPDELRQAPAQAPNDIAERYLSLPGISDRVADLARRVVAGQPTPFDRARALQDFFHNGDFQYSLSEIQGHDEQALENFLFGNRRGYCEQFAGAYAVMARLVGLPSRIAVGFTPGELAEDGLFHVRDEHAHAWPEVYLEGFGWVAFEPTVGRGAPGAESYTGRPEQQDESGSSTSATTVEETPTTIAGGETPSTDTTLPDLAGDVGTSTPDQRPSTGLQVVAALVLSAVAWVVVVPSLHLLHHRRRRRIIDGQVVDAHAELADADRVLAAWAEAEEALDRAGVRRRPSETLLEFSARAPASAGLHTDAAAAFRSLCRGAADVTYAPSGVVTGSGGEQAGASARRVRDAVLDQLSLMQRMAWWLDPRPLWNTRR